MFKIKSAWKKSLNKLGIGAHARKEAEAKDISLLLRVSVLFKNAQTLDKRDNEVLVRISNNIKDSLAISMAQKHEITASTIPVGCTVLMLFLFAIR